MKRGGPIPRKTPLRPGLATLKRSAPLRKEGETKKKKRRRYETYLRSPEWRAKRKACLERAGGRCECAMQAATYGEMTSVLWIRCPNLATTVHHRSYRHFGNELPEELLACCKQHHDELEAKLRPWNQNRRFR